MTAAHPGPKPLPSWSQETQDITGNNDYPWVVHIKKENEELCSATIVLPQWVISTEECIGSLARFGIFYIYFTDFNFEK